MHEIKGKDLSRQGGTVISLLYLSSTSNPKFSNFYVVPFLITVKISNPKFIEYLIAILAPTCEVFCMLIECVHLLIKYIYYNDTYKMFL